MLPQVPNNSLPLCLPQPFPVFPVPVYFEESWAILSSICLVNVFFGFMIIGITSLTPVSTVPIVVRRFSGFLSTLWVFLRSLHFLNSKISYTDTFQVLRSRCHC
jgi:hypothetical protein